MNKNNYLHIPLKIRNIAKSYTPKIVLGALLAILVLPTNAFALTATQELSAIDKRIKSINAEINQKRKQSDSLENEIAIIDAALARTDLSIKASNAELVILNKEIKTNTAQINKVSADLDIEHKKMSEYLRVIYEEGNTSFIEQIFKAKTFSEFVDKKEYLSATQLKLKEVADKIAVMKRELEQKQEALKKDQKRTSELKASQEAQRAAQGAQRAYRNQLLASVRAQQNGLQSKLNDLHARKAALSASFGESVIRGTSGYPYGSPPPRRIIDTPDPWGYLIGECTSYVAWKRAVTGRPVPRGLGNARTWGTRAAAMGLSVSRTPRAGDVMVMPYIGGYGHVAYVEAVYGAGRVLISEYNWTPYSYSTRVVNPYNYGALFIH